MLQPVGPFVALVSLGFALTACGASGGSRSNADTLNLDCQHGGQVHNEPGTMFRLSAPGGVLVRIAIAYSD